VQYYDLREDPEGTLRNWARFAMDVAPLAKLGVLIIFLKMPKYSSRRFIKD
jgi:KaiC/GvpD/RAD55 family RecA-like ATPase